MRPLSKGSIVDLKKKLSETKTWIKEHPWELAAGVATGAIAYAVYMDRLCQKKVEAHHDCIDFAHWVDQKLAQFPGETQMIRKDGTKNGFVYIEPMKTEES